jgi:hypothetical protein
LRLRRIGAAAPVGAARAAFMYGWGGVLGEPSCVLIGSQQVDGAFAAVLLIVSVLGLPIGLALGALSALSLFGGVLATAFFVGDVEARLMNAGPIVGRRRHALMLFAGVLTLAVLRALMGGVVVFVSVLFGLGALMLSMRHAWLRQSAASGA